MEPDIQLIEALGHSRGSHGEPKVVASTIDAFAESSGFDSILYIDVLEHIEDDAGELRRASARLAPGGKLIVLSPAHNVLYSEFDRAIGHFRRYSSRSLRRLTPDGMRLVAMRHLDSAGLILSLGNRLLLRQNQPTPRQIRFWDRVIIRMSRRIDPLIGYTAGRSIIAVWERGA
jgi:2-polyprenyl-3-methyl-5-hydroxy-6-metoxy-1,4-benzoquinol methylase